MAYTAYRVYLSLSDKDNNAMAAKGANYFSIFLYAKGNLTQHYNKPSSSHGF